jgi:hypothetical protein
VIDKQGGHNQEGTAAQQAPSKRPDFPLSESIGTSNQAIHHTEPTEPSSNNVERATKDLDSIRIAEWWLIGIQVCVLITGIVVCIIYGKQLTIMRKQFDVMQGQLNEMKSGSADTHELAIQAKNQADRTKDVADRALIQANATNALAKEAKRSADLSERTSHLDERAWVGPNAVSPFEIKAGEYFPSITVNVKNSGKTPAINFISLTAYRAFERGQKFRAIYDPVTATPSSTILQPNMELGLAPTSNPDRKMTEAHMTAMRNGDIVVYLFGKATYQDIFRQTHHFTFCMYVEKTLKTMASCNTYNSAD